MLTLIGLIGWTWFGWQQTTLITLLCIDVVLSLCTTSLDKA